MFEKFTEDAQKEIMGSMYESAKVLADNSNGLFCAYEPNLDKYKHQSLLPIPSHYSVEGRPIPSVDDSDTLATMIDSRYAGLPSSIEAHDEATGAVQLIGEDLIYGQNVALGLEHGELIDVALAEVGMSNILRRRNIAHRSGLIVSKAIDYMGVNIDYFGVSPDDLKKYFDSIDAQIDIEDDGTVQVRNFLKVAADITYMTIPSTKTFEDIRAAQKDNIRLINNRVISKINKDMKVTGNKRHPWNKKINDPLLLGVALPGTTVKLLDFGGLDEDHEFQFLKLSGKQTEVVGHISPRITDFMKGAITYATAIRLDDSPPKVHIDKDYLYLKNEEQVEELAAKLVKISKLLNPDVEYLYDKDGNLPVNRKSA